MSYGLKSKWGYFRRKYILNNFNSPYLRLCDKILDN